MAENELKIKVSIDKISQQQAISENRKLIETIKADSKKSIAQLQADTKLQQTIETNASKERIAQRNLEFKDKQRIATEQKRLSREVAEQEKRDAKQSYDAKQRMYNEMFGGKHKMSFLQGLEVGENITTIAAGLSAALYGITSLTKQSAMLSASLTVLRANFQGTQQDIELFRQATAGTVSDANLIKLSNQATDLGIGLDKQALLFSLAEDAADKYGGSVEENFSKVVMATEGNIRGLKSLGIQKEVYNKTVSDLVKSMGGEVEMLQDVNGEQEINIKKLDPAIQKQIRLEAVLKLTGVTLDSVKKKTQDQKDKLEAMSVKVEEAKTKFGELVMKGVEPLITNFLKLGDVGNIVVGGFTSMLGAAVPLMGTFAQMNLAFPKLLTSLGSIASITGIIGVGLANLVAHFNNINGVIDIFTGKIFESYKQSWAWKNLWGGDTTDSEANQKNESSWLERQNNRMGLARNLLSKTLKTQTTLPKVTTPTGSRTGKSERLQEEEKIKNAYDLQLDVIEKLKEELKLNIGLLGKELELRGKIFKATQELAFIKSGITIQNQGIVNEDINPIRNLSLISGQESFIKSRDFEVLLKEMIEPLNSAFAESFGKVKDILTNMIDVFGVETDSFIAKLVTGFDKVLSIVNLIASTLEAVSTVKSLFSTIAGFIPGGSIIGGLSGGGDSFTPMLSGGQNITVVVNSELESFKVAKVIYNHTNMANNFGTKKVIG